MSSNDTGKLIHDFLAEIADQYHFQFCIVDMREMETRFPLGGPGLHSVLSDGELRRLDTLRLHKHKIQWISGRYAVKSALFKLQSQNGLMMNLNNIDVIKGPDSAPYLLQYPGLHVSITHSAPYCIGVVSPQKIGIDLEAVSGHSDSLFKYYFSGKEQEIIRSLGETKERWTQAMIYWTRKEAVSKLLGLGMKMDFKGLDTSGERVEIDGLTDGGGIRLLSWGSEVYCLSVAVLP